MKLLEVTFPNLVGARKTYRAPEHDIEHLPAEHAIVIDGLHVDQTGATWKPLPAPKEPDGGHQPSAARSLPAGSRTTKR